MKVEEARSIPSFAGKVPLALAGEAAQLAEVLPHLVVEARNVAAQLQLGIHGRRRPGPGEEFWEFRPFVAGESTSRIDWRRSARDDRLYVREREWESAAAHWLWVDLSASMHFGSKLAERSKRDRAVLIALALADLLVHAGERVGLPGRTHPMASRNIIMRLAEALVRQDKSGADPLTMDALPESLPLKRHDHVVLIGDFIMPMPLFAERLARIAHRGARGTVVLVRDPVEEDFPFSGEFEFEGLESSETWRVGEAQDIASRYRERIAAINEEMRRIALGHGFGFVRHLTHRPAAETLLALAALIGGQAPSAHSVLGGLTMIAGLSFLAPFALIALVALPALLFLLRITPPPPRRLPLPTLPLVKDILGKEREPARTPWWLLVLRLLAAAAVILAVAGPRWQPRQETQPASGDGPLVVMIDDGWPAASTWPTRIARAQTLMEQAASRPVILLATGDDRPNAQPETAATALTRLMSLRPRPHFPQRDAAFEAALGAGAGAAIVWISDGVQQIGEGERINRFIAAAGNRLDIVSMQPSSWLALAGLGQTAEGMEAVIRRPADATEARQGLVRAFDDKGRLLGDTTFALATGAQEAKARLALPIEILNDMARIEIADEKHAGAVHLLDSAHRRRRVALISGETTDTAQPLVSARYFVSRALQPFADLREPPRGVPDPIGRALEERPDVLVLVDIGTLAGETAVAITRFVETGGMLVRFAGPGLAAASDELLPVRLRRGGRTLGGALSWDKPRKLGIYPDTSPFFGLPQNTDIQVERQVLAEPDAELSRASWAVLEDGTPLVTGAARGRGQIVLFHVTGDTSWSNLPLSGAFVDMLRRTLLIAKSQGTADAGSNAGRERLAARNTLDGFGQLGGPAPTARPVDPRYAQAGTHEYPPGFYGPAEAGLAVNALTLATQLEPIRYGTARVSQLSETRAVDFRPWLMMLAAILFVADALAVALLSGLTSALSRNRGLMTRGAALLLTIGLGALTLAPRAEAQAPGQGSSTDLRSIRQEDIRSSLRPRLAYIITGDSRIDETSRAGLAGLGQILQQRTSVSLDEPIGLDPARDELVFYSMIYWPILPGQAAPSERAIRAIDSFMKQGGTVVFDTRDAFVQRPGGMPTTETRALRAMLSSLDIPALEPIPPDHVLTKTFYLLDRFVGRYAAGDTWVEALAGQRDAKTPARAGDRVSPIIITSNDLASAWAVDRLGNPMFPLVPGEPRQREMAYRTGVNIVMYVMTGNYKADQVHVPALLERLGQ